MLPESSRTLSRAKRRTMPLVISCAAAMLAFSNLACRPQESVSDDPPKTTTPNSQPELAAETILASMQQAYASASSYRDQAKLHLTYQLQGRWLKETHLWSVDYRRPNRLAASIYNMRLKADGRQLSCFMFDFSSDNLDNQHVVLPISGGLNISRLLDDELTRHFLSGQAELPINTQLDAASETFSPPALWLLTGERTVSWINEATPERLADEEVDGKPCFQLRLRANGLEYFVWIDCQNSLLRQIRYPPRLLDRKLHENPALSHLELVAKFERATLDPKPPSTFALELPTDAKLVKQFVRVPEPFPSDSIGRPIPSLPLQTPLGAQANSFLWRGKVTLLAWSTSDDEDPQPSSLIPLLAAELSTREYHFADIFVPTNGDTDTPADDNRDGQRHNVTKYIDASFEAGRALGLRDFPFVAAIDRDGVLQYAASWDPKEISLEKVKKVLVRIRSGDDVATEMQQDYHKFLEAYRQRLAQASIRPSDFPDQTDSLAPASVPAHFSVQQFWVNDELEQPGNIVAFAPDDESATTRLVVLDGWRSVAEIAPSGRLRRRVSLELGPNQSVSQIRTSGTGSRTRFAVFSAMGEHVHVFSQEFVSPGFFWDSKGQICDVQLIDDGTEPQLAVALIDKHGIVAIGNPQRSTTDRTLANDIQVRRFFVLGDDGSPTALVIDEQGQLVSWRASGPPKPIECGISTATEMAVHTGHDGKRICVLGTDEQSRWNAIGLNAALERTWLSPIGPQQFDSQVQSIAFARLPGSKHGLWAIAGSNGSITLIDDGGEIVDQWNLGRSIDGLALLSNGTDYSVVFSTEQRLECWTLTPSTSTASERLAGQTEAARDDR